MEQWNAVGSLVEQLKKDKAVRAIFLKGSLAREDWDQFSDIDLYCLVHEIELDSFLTRRLACLEEYAPLLFWTEVNFVGPQIVAVFENGLHVDLYTVTAETLQQTDVVKVLYDPEELLGDYAVKSFPLSSEAVLRTFNSLAFSLLEFAAAFNRGNLIWASRLASHISSDIVLLLRYIYDPERAQLGFKRVDKYVPADTYQAVSDALDNIGPTKLPHGLVTLLDLLEELIPSLPAEIKENLNLAFYNFTAEIVRQLK